MPSPSPTPTPSPRIGPDDVDDEALATPSPDDTEVVTALREALQDSDEGVRKQAAWALKMLMMKKGDMPPRMRDRMRLRERLRDSAAPRVRERDEKNQ
jgi:hypothetical protein